MPARWQRRADYVTDARTVRPLLARLLRVNIGSKLPPAQRAAANALGRRPRYFQTMIDEIDGLDVGALRSSTPDDLPVEVLYHSDPKAIFIDPEAEARWPELQSELASRYHTRAQKVEGSGHFIQLDRPSVVANAIERVVSRVRERTA